MLNKLNNILINNNVNTEIDELEYHGGYKEGIIIIFPTGECLQVFYDGKFLVIDEHCCEWFDCKSEHVTANYIINYYEEKMQQIKENDRRGYYMKF